MVDTIDEALYTSIITYILAMIIIVVIKPKFLYDKEKQKFKSFGTDKDETVFAMPVMSVISCVIIYFLVVLYMLLMISLKS